MTILYSSIEAAEVRCNQPDKCENCGSTSFTRMTRYVVDTTHQMYWQCDNCPCFENGVLYANKHSLYPIWSEAQTRAIIERRRTLKLSLKDMSADAGIGVSRLADFERRHDAPMPEQHALIMAVLGLVWIAQAHYIDSSAFIGVFSSDVNAKKACQQWRDERDDEPFQLTWMDGKTMTDMPMSNTVERDGVTAYVVHLAVIDSIEE